MFGRDNDIFRDVLNFIILDEILEEEEKEHRVFGVDDDVYDDPDGGDDDDCDDFGFGDDGDLDF